MKSFSGLAFIIVLLPCLCGAQVSDIKRASSSHNPSGSNSGGDGSTAAGNILGDLVFNIFIGGIIHAQQNKLQRRHEVPGMVSLDVMLQAAAQPSSYYMLHPRVRANWGLFSTDFRFNYIVEPGFDGTEVIRTNDWQILQLNLITTRDVGFRIGGGVLQEAFNDRQGFPEWTTAFLYQPHGRKLGGFAEYRGAEPRKEVSAFAQYHLFDRKPLHLFTTAGFVYQRYYQSITTWGFQGGIILKLY